jgi:hypothetical protein
LGREKFIQGIGGERCVKTEHLEDPGVDARIILKWIFRKWDGGVDWIDLA